jgi:hypothetical protein
VGFALGALCNSTRTTLRALRDAGARMFGGIALFMRRAAVPHFERNRRRTTIRGRLNRGWVGCDTPTASGATCPNARPLEFASVARWSRVDRLLPHPRDHLHAGELATRSFLPEKCAGRRTRDTTPPTRVSQRRPSSRAATVPNERTRDCVCAMHVLGPATVESGTALALWSRLLHVGYVRCTSARLLHVGCDCCISATIC